MLVQANDANKCCAVVSYAPAELRDMQAMRC